MAEDGGAAGFALSPNERRTLRVVCDTLLPALAAEPADDPRLFALRASDMGVDHSIEQALATVSLSQQRQFRRLLRALEQPFIVRGLFGRWGRFSDLHRAQRERALLALTNSPVPLLRTGFQGLKRLATFLFYTLIDEQGNNPTWSAIGYVPSNNPPAVGPTLRLTSIPTAMTMEYDVCVIGSGAGGSVVAAELAAAGQRVVVLEAGGGRQAPDFDQGELVGMQNLYLDGGLTATGDLGIAILAGATLGGGTTVNWQTSLRTPDRVRDEWSDLSGCHHFSDHSFSAALGAITARLNVNADESVVNANNAVLRDGCNTLGYRVQTIPAMPGIAIRVNAECAFLGAGTVGSSQRR